MHDRSYQMGKEQLVDEEKDKRIE
ncbi:MAG: hypothetical protein H6R42_927, partial [Nitrospirae bacterium]|nr:hypothetical protein [Nitrospirota bacterium]